MRPRRAREAFWRWEQAWARRTRDIFLESIDLWRKCQVKKVCGFGGYEVWAKGPNRVVMEQDEELDMGFYGCNWIECSTSSM